ncbi:lipopolysaccharide biosynthesis protein [Devosia sp. BK]|uniref:lipopolysaccharide biosynthesis protein n=1 Tax=Devosia sp. BK TaxID=2871706 RepID=UPI00293B3957|nr:lipopolysaccharide biosynthesis protein [Devosia sp. BK]
MVVFFVLARILSPADIGALSMIAAIIVLVQVATESTLAEYIVQEQNNRADQINSIFWGQVGISTFAALIVAGTAPWWAISVIGHDQSVAMTQVLSVAVIISAIGRVPDALLRSELKYKQIAVRSLISTVAGAAVGLSAALLGFGIWSLVAKQLTESAVDCAASFLVSRWRPGAPSIANLGEPLKYGIGLAGVYAVSVLNSQLDFFVIGAVLGPVALGLYAVSYRISQTVNDMFAGVVSRTSVPIISKGKGNPAELRSLHLRMLTLVTIAAIPIYVVLFVVSRPALIFLAGEQWASGAVTMQILCIAGPIAVAGSLNAGVLIAMKKTGTQFRITGASLLLSAVLFFVSAHWGLEAVAGASVLRMIATSGIGTYAAAKVTTVSVLDIVGAVIPSVIVGLVGGVCASIVMSLTTTEPPWLQLFASGIVACLAMGVVMLAIYRKRIRVALASLKAKTL